MNSHLANADQSSLGSNWAAGDIMYRDLNGDHQITRGAQTLDDHGDLKVIGNSTPRYLVGLNLNAAWKGFDISAFFQGVMKRDWWIGGSWGGGLEYLFGTTNSWEWWSVGITDVQDYYRDANTWSVQNGYQKANQDAWLPRVQFSDKNEQAQTRYLMDGSYIRLKNVQLGYTLPRTLTQQWGISNLRVFVSAENLDMPHQFDPELMSTSVNQNNGYPLQKTFAFGLNVSF